MMRVISLKSFFLACLFVSFHAQSQCTVTITPLGDTSFCQGDSVVLVASAPAGGADILDQSQTVYNGGTSARTLAGYTYWQSFRAGITGTLSKIEIGFFNYINGTAYLTVWQGEGTAGALLDSFVVPVFCPAGNCLLPFAMNIAVTAGQYYTFQIRPGPGIPDPYGIQVSVPGSYTNGKMGFVDPSGTYDPGFDMVFNTYVQGQGQATLVWSTGSTDSLITVHEEGVYAVTATGSGCTDSASQLVTVLPLPVVDVETEEDSFCAGSSPVTLIGSPPGGVFTGIHVSNGVFNPVDPGSHSVIYFYTDSNNCTDSASTKIRVIECTAIRPIGDAGNISCAQYSESLLLVEIDRLLVGSEFSLYSLSGESAVSTRLLDVTTFVDVSLVAPGIYIFNVKEANRFIKAGKITIRR